MSKRQKLETELAKFLEQKQKCEGTGWPVVETEDVNQLYEIIRLIIDEKFERDCDGDSPINFTIIDRTRYEPLHFIPVRYDHKAETDEEKEEILGDHFLNLSMAMDRVNTQMKIRQFDRNEKKRKRKKI